MIKQQAIEQADCIINDRRRLQALADYQILDSEYEAAYDGIVKLASNLCDTPIAVINFIDDNRQWFKSEMGLGVRETPLDISICRHAVLEQDVMVINDTQTDERTQSNPLVMAGEKSLRFYAGVLLKFGDHPLGTLCVLDYHPRTITAQQLNGLKLLRDQIMHLLEVRRLHTTQRLLLKELDESRNELQRQAYLDPLTGLLNRRAFESRLRFELESSASPANQCSLMMLDLNNFKTINDIHGHLHGDKVLQQVAHQLRQATRDSDILARWGGDEFLVLLPSTALAQAQEVAERISRALEKKSAKAGLPIEISASIGISTLHNYRSVHEVIDAVDTAMYEAKRSGSAAGPKIKLATNGRQSN